MEIDYNNPENIEKLIKRFYNYGMELVIKSNYDNWRLKSKKFFDSFKIKKNFKKLLIEKELQRIYLGIGTEFLIKSYFLKKGYILHKSRIPSKPIKISELNKNEIKLNFNKMFGIEDLKNNLPKDFPKRDKSIQAINLIQNWRNGLIHQLDSPNREDSNIGKSIQNLLFNLGQEILRK
jgi:hypothetical protein